MAAWWRLRNLWVARRCYGWFMADVKENEQAEITVDIEAEPEVVWDSLTTSDGLAEWFGEGSFVGSEPGDDLHVLDPVTGRPKSGIVEKIKAGECLEYTWWPIGAPDEASRVAITLLPCETGTRVTVVERPLLSSSMSMSAVARDRATAGWNWRGALLAVGVGQLVC